MPKYDFHMGVSCKFAAYFQNTFSQKHPWLPLCSIKKVVSYKTLPAESFLNLVAGSQQTQVNFEETWEIFQNSFLQKTYDRLDFYHIKTG